MPVLPKPKLSGFFLSGSFPLDLNLFSLITHFPFQISGHTQNTTGSIHICRLLQAQPNPWSSSHKYATEYEVSLPKSRGKDCPFASYFLLSDAITHKVEGACSWQKQAWRDLQKLVHNYTSVFWTAIQSPPTGQAFSKKMSSRLPAVISHKFIKERNTGLCTVTAEKSTLLIY